MMACIIFLIINIYRLYYYYGFDMDGALMYLCDGHILYGYSFLVDLDILSTLVQLVFSFGKLQEIYGSFRNFATDLPRENKNKTQCKYE